MRELIYTLLELEREYKGGTCDFCSNKNNEGINQITTRVKISGKYVSDDVVCENCKEKFENDELLKCERCGRLQTQLDIDMLCRCITRKENLEEKELPSVPYESQATFYERQINSLQEQLTTAEWTISEEREAHEDFMEKSEEWGKRQKQELLDEIKRLKEEVERLKKLTPQELIKENEQLKAQLEQLNSQSTAQIEVKTDKKFRFLPFGKKS